MILGTCVFVFGSLCSCVVCMVTSHNVSCNVQCRIKLGLQRLIPMLDADFDFDEHRIMTPAMPCRHGLECSTS